MSKYKYLIISDLDGTLLNEDGQLSKNTIEYIHELNKRDDVLFTFSTGRSWQESSSFFEILQLKSFVSCCNGAFLYDPHKNLSIHQFISREFCVQILGYDDLFANLRKGHILTDKQHLTFTDKKSREESINALNSGNLNVYDLKFYYYNDKISSSELDRRISFIKSLSFNPTICVFIYPNFNSINIELHSNASDKEFAMKWLSNYFGVPACNILTMGDQINDISTALGESYFVAVANAIPVIKQNARSISVFTNDEDSVIKEIDIFLKKKVSCLI